MVLISLIGGIISLIDGLISLIKVLNGLIGGLINSFIKWDGLMTVLTN